MREGACIGVATMPRTLRLILNAAALVRPRPGRSDHRLAGHTSVPPVFFLFPLCVYVRMCAVPNTKLFVTGPVPRNLVRDQKVHRSRHLVPRCKIK